MTMTLSQAMQARHSVRTYDDRPLTAEDTAALREEVELINRLSGMDMQLFVDEPKALASGLASYGQFKGCRNYLAVVGPKGMSEAAGYWGEHLVLFAQTRGIHSCWVGLTYKKKAVIDAEPAQSKRYAVIALGYSQNSGTPHKSKTIEQVSDYTDASPRWYRSGIEAALLAPTAMNQQRFHFSRKGEVITLKPGFGPFTKMDAGIVKYHFELGAAGYNFDWAK